jgi:hypothetical protein
MTWKRFVGTGEMTIAPAYLDNTTDEEILFQILRNMKIQGWVYHQKHYRDMIQIELFPESLTIQDMLGPNRALVIVDKI